MDNSRQAYRDIHALAGDLQQSTLVQGGRLHIECLKARTPVCSSACPNSAICRSTWPCRATSSWWRPFWPADQVHDRAGLNEQMLRLQSCFSPPWRWNPRPMAARAM